MSVLAAQTRVELTLTLRRGESLLLTLGIPVLLLVFFGLVDVLPTDGSDPVDFLAPGILALAVMSTAMVGLGIATGFERQYKVLKRLGSTPLGRPALLGAKIAGVVLIELLQLAVLVPTAYLLGWRPPISGWAVATVAIVVGTVAFAGLGLAMAGVLRGEINLAAQNGVYLVLLLFGGIIFPLTDLPTGLETLAKLLPSTALATILRAAFSTDVSVPGWAIGVLIAWAVAAPLVAARTFRWE